jgi:hypothetical protein
MDCECPSCKLHVRPFIYMVIFALVVYFLTKNVQLTAGVLAAHFVLFHLL